MKKCTKCKVEKEITKFGVDKQRKDGLYPSCKECSKEYRKENKDKKKEYYKKNKDKIKEYEKEYYKKNKENKKEYYKENKDKINKCHKEYYEKNKDKVVERVKEYYKENKDKIIERQNEYVKNRKLSDPLFKMKCNLRTRTSLAFKNKGYSKNTKTQEMLGVDWEIAKKHIERQFTKGMNWSNQGDWHIDHIIPLSSANTEERLKKLCHYTNLQPLWAVDNLIKSDVINGQQNKFRF